MRVLVGVSSDRSDTNFDQSQNHESKRLSSSLETKPNNQSAKQPNNTNSILMSDLSIDRSERGSGTPSIGVASGSLASVDQNTNNNQHIKF